MTNDPTSKLANSACGQAKPPVIEFDLHASKTDIEQRLEEARRNADRESREPAPAQIAPSAPDQTITAPKPAPPATAAKEDEGSQSALLKSLAQEAEKKLAQNQAQQKLSQASAQRLHDALERIYRFLTPFSQHVNTMAPEINRSYRLDARTSYSALKWQKATTDYRKQNLSESALLAFVTFGLHLRPEEPVVVTRPWDQLDALKRELQNLKLRVIDETELNSKRVKQEWLQVRLAPNLPVLLEFKGNYEGGCIDVRSLNLESFGPVSFKLAPQDVTPELLDDLGLFLLGRSDKLPAALHRL